MSGMPGWKRNFVIVDHDRRFRLEASMAIEFCQQAGCIETDGVADYRVDPWVPLVTLCPAHARARGFTVG